MDLEYILGFLISTSLVLGVCSSQDEVDNGYIFTSPKTLHKGQNNQLQLLRFGCLEESVLKVQVYYSKEKSSDSKETLAKEETFQLQEGEKYSLLQLFLDHSGDGDDAKSGRIQINGTLCRKPIRGSDDVHFSTPKPYIYIIQTEKYLYKPGQKVKFRVLKLDKDLKPTNKANDTGDIYVENSKGIRLFQFKGVQLGQGIVQKEFSLADYLGDPVNEIWKITVNSEQDSASKNFYVDKYEFPKFSISINFPSLVLRNAETIPISVCAKYTYGESVKGRLKLSTSLGKYVLDYYTHKPYPPVLKDTVQIDGCYNYTVQVSSLDPEGNEKGRPVTVEANLVEDGTGVEINQSGSVERPRLPLKLDFITEENNGEFYKPGLPYNGKLTVLNPANSPAIGEPIEICANVSRKRVVDNLLGTSKIKYCRNYSSDDDGYIKFTIAPQIADTVSIDLEANSLKYTRDNTDLDHPTVSTSLSPYYSPSRSFLQIETISNPLPCGTRKNIKVLFTSKDNSEFKLHYQILKQGKVVSNGVKEVIFDIQDDVSIKYDNGNEITDGVETQLIPSPEPSSYADSSSSEEYCPNARKSGHLPHIGEAYIPIDVDSDLSPDFTLLVFYVREDRETVAHSQHIPVEKCFKHKVDFQFADAQKHPGNSTSIRVTSTPNSLCGVRIMDNNLALLNSHDQLTTDKVFQLLGNFNTDVSDSSTDLCDGEKSQPGLASTKPAKITSSSNSHYASAYEDSFSAFQEAGISVISNLILFSRPCTGNSGHHDKPVNYDAYNTDDTPHVPTPVFQAAVNDRENFPETWLFQLQMTGPDGIYESKETLPPTITKWVGNAVCVSPQNGLGISDTSSIYGFQPFFISYTLPVSIIRGEEVSFFVSISSYADAALPITISLEPSDGFVVISDLSDTDVCIQPKTTNSQRIKLQSTKIGKFNFTVRAETTSSKELCSGSPVYDSFAKEALAQSVEVEAEGFPIEETNSLLVCPQDAENQQFSQSYNLNTPDEAVADSARATVAVTGNVMGPALKNLNHLLSLPLGCGEQNMLKFTPIHLVLDYLTSIGELTDGMKTDLITKLSTGFQSELAYRRYDSSFGAFGNYDYGPRDGSMFLTAFVLRSFHQAKKYIFIQDSVLTDAQEWIISKQQTDGCFPDLGDIINSGIQGGLEARKNNGVITAYVLASLLISNYNNFTVIANGMSCMSKHPASTPYETFLYAYVGALSGNKGPTQNMLNNIKSQANITDDMEYYQNPGGSKSQEIETAAYAVLTNIKLGNSKSQVLPLVRYLIANMNPSGGFESTQDTIVGLDALSKFAKFVYNDPVSLSVTVSGGLEEKVNVSKYNQLALQSSEVTQIPSALNIHATGTGCALLQTSLRYNTLSPPERNDFNIEAEGECVDASPDCKQRKITIAVKYLPKGKESGMSIVQIKMVTGIVPNEESLQEIILSKYDIGISHNENIMKYEVENNKVNLYFSEIYNEAQKFSFIVEVKADLENRQPGIAKVFDYYSPEYSASTAYTFSK